MWAADGAVHATGAARRRRERRLHAHLRYARMSVAMALAEARHHTAPQGQKTARAEAKYDAFQSQRTSVVGDTESFSLTASLASGRRCGFCGAPWSRSSTQCRLFRRCPLSFRFPNSRASYRSAQGLPRGHPFATLVSRTAAGGTAGGSADDSLLPQADH